MIEMSPILVNGKKAGLRSLQVPNLNVVLNNLLNIDLNIVY